MELEEVLQQLTPIQLRFVAARLTTKSDADAAREVGVLPAVMYNWENKDMVREAVKLAQLDIIAVARVRLKNLVHKAVDVIEDEMENPRGSGNRLTSALQVLDRMGLPRGLDLTTGGESFVLSEEDRNKSLAKLADILRDRLLGAGDGGWDIVDADECSTVVSLPEPSG